MAEADKERRGEGRKGPEGGTGEPSGPDAGSPRAEPIRAASAMKAEGDAEPEEVEIDDEPFLVDEEELNRIVTKRLIEERLKKSARGFKEAQQEVAWVPRTRLGRMVKSGQIRTMSEALATRLPLREPEIVDILLPDLEDEVLEVKAVQRMTDSGRRIKYAITAVVGNGDGFVGFGQAKGREVGPAIRKCIDNAKLNIIEVRRGCGSWECGCGNPHTLPYAVTGRAGSVEVRFKPAPNGVGLAVGNVAKHVLRLAGIHDAWGFTRGETRTTINYGKAAFDALRKTSIMKVAGRRASVLPIKCGAIDEIVLDSADTRKALIEEARAEALAKEAVDHPALNKVGEIAEGS